MRFLLTILAVMMTGPLAFASAQEPSDVDIAGVADRVSSADTERLLMRLNTPIPDDALPPEFSDARPMPGDTLAQQRATFDDALDGITGSVIYTIDYTPETIDASPTDATAATPAGSPAARASQFVFSSSTLTYIVFSEAPDLSDPAAFGSALQAAMGSEAQMGSVEQVTLNDAPAFLISAMAVVNAVELHAQWIAVPVGNVIVIGMIMTGSDTFDEAAFDADNEALVLSGIMYLEIIVSE